MSWFSTVDPNAPVLHPVQLAHDQQALFGPLEEKDTQWLCAGGFVTETQTFYATTKDGGLVMCQVIHSSVGVWYPSIQFTFRYVNTAKSQHVWKSTAVTNFLPEPKDKRSCKADQFSITVDSTGKKYTIIGKYDDEVQISLTYERLTEGWKVGAGPRGGMTYFGAAKAPSASSPNPDTAGGADGYAIHRFWPQCAVSGIVRLGKEVVDLAEARGTFIHAIQGMRPNVLAAKWNFANFHSSSNEEGVVLTMMEFTTTPAYGGKKVNIGSVVVGDKLVAITAGGEGVQGRSVALHLGPVKDVETGYDAPSSIQYSWEGATISEGKVAGGAETKATLTMDLITSGAGEAYATRGLIEKVDVLGQIPYLVKKFVNYAAGTKPYIYTWLNPATATISTPSKEGELKVEGTIFSEATWVSGD